MDCRPTSAVTIDNTFVHVYLLYRSIRLLLSAASRLSNTPLLLHIKTSQTNVKNTIRIKSLVNKKISDNTLKLIKKRNKLESIKYKTLKDKVELTELRKLMKKERRRDVRTYREEIINHHLEC